MLSSEEYKLLTLTPETRLGGAGPVSADQRAVWVLENAHVEKFVRARMCPEYTAQQVYAHAVFAGSDMPGFLLDYRSVVIVTAHARAVCAARVDTLDDVHKRLTAYRTVKRAQRLTAGRIEVAPFGAPGVHSANAFDTALGLPLFERVADYPRARRPWLYVVPFVMRAARYRAHAQAPFERQGARVCYGLAPMFAPRDMPPSYVGLSARGVYTSGALVLGRRRAAQEDIEYMLREVYE